MQELTFGWEEWIALPELGLPAIKAKIDTGARTSALHAHDIEVFGSDAKPKVRFNVHPVAGNEDIVITCSAPIIAIINDFGLRFRVEQICNPPGFSNCWQAVR